MTPATLPKVNQPSQNINPSPQTSAPSTPHLSLRVSCSNNQLGNSFIAQQYATYPFRLSGNLPVDNKDLKRVYAYIMGVSPGILSGDDLRLAFQVSQGAQLYLTDQSSTKVHSRPTGGATAQVTYTINVGEQAYLEYVPEPVILFAKSAFTQNMQVTLHPQGRLILSEIIVPGRLARGEYYAFDRFQSRLHIQTPEGKLCFTDNLRLTGRSNVFKDHSLLADLPILGNFIVVVPGISLTELAQTLDTYKTSDELSIGYSRLPGCNGLLVRALSNQVSILQNYQHFLLNNIRQLTGNPTLPDIPK